MADRESSSSPEALDDPTSNPASPSSVDDSSAASTPFDMPSSDSEMIPSLSPSEDVSRTRRMPSLRTVSDPQNTTSMSSSSTVSGILQNARRPPVSVNSLPLDLMQKARALQQQRMGRAPIPPANSGGGSGGMGTSMAIPPNMAGGLMGGLPGNLKLPPGMARPVPPNFPKSAPAVPGVGPKQPLSLSERRAMKMKGFGGPESSAGAPRLSDMGGGQGQTKTSVNGEGRGTQLNDFKQYIDTEKGWITFEGAATITRTGVNFANGKAFTISLDEVDVMDELGKGNYGTVYKVKHARPKAPRFGQGLGGSLHASRQLSMSFDHETPDNSSGTSPTDNLKRSTTGVIMAMKEIRLELDEAKFATILKELVILHECVSPYIIDFYGAFFQEGAVYMCIEYMDGGSIDKLYEGGIPENVLRKITYATVMGLKTLKDDHNIIHRDVKPTNILVNANGQVKICDFGVSGNLVASIAKTNIGCQSYMAPERISGGGMAMPGGMVSGSYNVQSDIWSLGLTVIECAMGRYPYPPEVSSTIFSQLSAIVEGDPPDLPADGFSPVARDFVRSCLNKVPAKRHTYPMLLMHPWIKSLSKPETIAEDAEAEDAAADDDLADAAGALNLSGPTNIAGGDYEVAEWVRNVLDRKAKGLLKGTGERPALHAAPLDSLSPVGSPLVTA